MFVRLEMVLEGIFPEEDIKGRIILRSEVVVEFNLKLKTLWNKKISVALTGRQITQLGTAEIVEIWLNRLHHKTNCRLYAQMQSACPRRRFCERPRAEPTTEAYPLANAVFRFLSRSRKVHSLLIIARNERRIPNYPSNAFRDTFPS